MLPSAIGLLILLLTASNTTAAEPPKLIPPRDGKSEMLALFNGKTLEGWEGHEKLWSVKDGAIVGRYAAITEPNTFLLTKKSFSDFHLKVTAKVVKSNIHTAVSLWGQKADPVKAKDPFAYQAGYLVVFPEPYGLVDKFGRNFLKVNTAPWKKAGKPKDWNEIEILALGNRCRVAINGVLVVDWVEEAADRIMPGPIGLELHGGKETQEVRFKDITITTFPKDTSRFDGVKVGEPLKGAKK
jgi:hypothetical protein